MVSERRYKHNDGQTQVNPTYPSCSIPAEKERGYRKTNQHHGRTVVVDNLLEDVSAHRRIIPPLSFTG
jgi:hypothetical protein